MPFSPRFWVSLVRSLALVAWAGVRRSAVPLVVTVVVGLVLVPLPWEGRASAAEAKTRVRPHELVGLRDAFSSTRVSADGLLVTRVSRQSVHWFDREVGVWREIDTDLSASAKAGVGWVSGSNRFSVEVAEQTREGQEALVSIEGRAGEIGIALEDATAGKQGVKSSANEVVFRGVRPDVDLEYVVLPDGVKENIVLRSAGAPSSYAFRLTPGKGEVWRAERLEESGLWMFFVDGSPEPGFVLLPPSVGDSSQIPVEELRGADGVPRWVHTVAGKASLEVEQEDDGSFVATVSVDEKWLGDPARVFPVVLDPTVYAQPDVADGWYDTVNGGNPVFESMLRLGAHGVGSPAMMSVLTFDVASIPPGASVVDARLNAYLDNCFPGSCDGGNWGSMRVRRLTGGWSAGTPWSVVSGSIEATSLDTVDYASGVAPTLGWQTWAAGPLTGVVQGMVNGSVANYGFILDKTYTGSPTSVAGAIASDDAASFNGSAKGSVTASPGSYGITTSATLEAWVNIPDSSRKGAFVQVGSGSNGFAIGVGSTNFDGLGNNPIGLYESVRWISSAVSIGTGWHHVAMTVSGGTATLFLDGSQVTSSTGSGPVAPTGGFNVGGYSTRMFSGVVDEAAVYGSALDPGRIHAHYLARAPSPVYLHQSYDANGRLAWISLPTATATPGGVSTGEKTTNTYWDSGAIASSKDPTGPKVRFDYTAEGWQSSRIPELRASPGTLDFGRSMYWLYHPDGLVRSLRDEGGEHAKYAYDANGNRTQAVEAIGLLHVGQTPLQLDFAYDSLDQLVKTRTPKPSSSNYLATYQSYDPHGNTTVLDENREENAGGSQVTAGRVFSYTYSALDQVTGQVDDFATGATSDDQQLVYTYTDRAEPSNQTLQKGGTGAWVTEQSSERTYLWNGQLKTLTNRNAAGAMLEQHTLSYLRNGIYLNGNRASDVFQLKGPDSGAACYSTTCTASWTYDARDRLVQETNGSGVTTTFALDTVGNVTAEAPTSGAATSRSYNAQQLVTQTTAGTTIRFFYDAYGNQDCAVKSAYAGTACPGSGADLLEDWLFDYKNRLAGYRSYNGSGGLVTRVDWVNDPLDRPISQATTSGGSTTSYAFRYIGASDLLSTETLTGATSATRRYTYDAFGRRATITDGANRYSYQHDPHGSVSLLLDQTGVAKASYGYGAYGIPNAALTKTAAGFNAATNAYRYTGKRTDTASNTLDMGARRYTPSSGRFLQADSYNDALANLHLSLNPLATNRYALAAGNPINYTELDGHMVMAVEEQLNPGDRAWVQQQLRDQIAKEAAAACHTTDRCTSDRQKTIEVAETASVFLPLPLPNKLRAALKGTNKLWKWARPSKKAAKAGTALVRAPDFASEARAFEHYAKHARGVELGPRGAARPKPGGADMPEFGTFAEYRTAARQFLGEGRGPGVLQKTRPNGDIVRVDPATGYYGVRTRGGVIRTFFRPDGNPVAYYRGTP